MYKTIAEILKELVGCEYLHFDEVLQIKMSPHSDPIRLWGASVSPSGKVFVMDAEQDWYEMGENEYPIMQSLVQRLYIIQQQYSIAS